MLLRTCISVGLFYGVLSAQPQMTCKRVDTPPNTIRAEGASELLSDLLIACTGGTPSSGGRIGQYQLMVVSSAPLNLRMVPPPKPSLTPVIDGSLQAPVALSDALAILDEPQALDQRPCVPVAPADSCPVESRAANAPNIFQGSLIQENVVFFPKVPIDPPGEGKTRYIRITNLRASAFKIAKPDANQISLTAQIFDSKGTQVAVENATQVAAIAKPGIVVSLHTVDNGEVAPLSPALTVTPSLLPQNNPGRAQAFVVRFTEGFPSAFKRRSLGTTASDPGYVVTQADPGGPANTESGFFNSSFPSENGLDSAGLADNGTRLKVVLTQIPENVQIWASARDSETGTTGYSPSSPRALLGYTRKTGSGPFSKNSPAHGDFSLFIPEDGTVTLVWEVMAANANALESLGFEIRAFSPNGVARVGTAFIHASPAPVLGEATTTDINGVKESIVPSLPSFLENAADPVPAFRIVPTLSSGPLTALSAASMSGTAVAPDSIVTLLGNNLSILTDSSGASPVASIADVKVDVIDNSGTSRSAPLFMISPQQINILLNPETAPGQAAVIVRNGSREVATGTVRVNAVAPGLFSAAGNGRGRALGEAVLVTEADTRTAELTTPLDVVSGAAFLRLYGTGIRGRSSLAAVSLKIGNETIPVTFAGPKAEPGMDQIEAGPLPRSLAGRGEVTLTLSVDGRSANPVTVVIK
jgi:uncharacterized protein (TIGR03437 family)